MHGIVPPRAVAASFPALASEAVPLSEPRGEFEFAALARALLGKDAGLHLHRATGWAESSCYAFAAKDESKRRKPNLEFFRALCHSDHGRPFLLAFMDGCTAPWWCEIERDLRLAEVGRRFINEVQNLK